MRSDETATKLAALTDSRRVMAQPAPVTKAVQRDITALDRNRMAVSLIYSIFQWVGTDLASARFWINFRKRGAGFTLQSLHPNQAGGGQRLMHTIIPQMQKQDDRAILPLGVLRRACQTFGHVRFVTNRVDYGPESQTAIDAPPCLSGAGGMMMEIGYSPKLRAELAQMGHQMAISPEPICGARSILIDNSGILIGASDPRKDDRALGY